MPIDESAFFSTLVSLAHDAVIVVDISQIIVFVNDSAERIFGYSASELIGKKLDILLPLETIRPHSVYVQRFADAAEVSREMHIRYEVSGRRKDGSIFPVSASIAKVQNNGNLFFASIVRDLTDRKRRQMQLDETQRISQTGSWELDLIHNHLVWTDQTFRIFEIDPEKFSASYEAFLATVHPEDRAAVDFTYTNSLKTRQPYQIIHRLLMKDGRIKYVEERCKHDYNEEGVPVRSIGTVQDVTIRKLAEERIEAQVKHLAALRSIDTSITSGAELIQTLDILLENALVQLKVDAACVFLVNPKKQSLEYAAGRGFLTDWVKKAKISIGDPFAGVVVLERNPISVLDFSLVKKQRSFARFWKAENIIAYYAAPLIVKDQVKGVLEVFVRSPSCLLQNQNREWLDFLEALAGQAAIAVDHAELFHGLQCANSDLILAYDETIEGWSQALDLRDKETEGHTRRVTDMTIELARKIGFNDSEIIHIRRGALLHDIGKMGIPDRILHKTDSLTAEEWKIMRQHPQFAYEMLSSINYLKPALDIPYCHHEKWDGSGYPRGLRGEQIPLVARIFALVDVWDALRSDRPYRKKWSRAKTIDYIQKSSGTHFDPVLAKIFLDFIKQRETKKNGS